MLIIIIIMVITIYNVQMVQGKLHITKYIFIIHDKLIPRVVLTWWWP